MASASTGFASVKKVGKGQIVHYWTRTRGNVYQIAHRMVNSTSKLNNVFAMMAGWGKIAQRSFVSWTVESMEGKRKHFIRKKTKHL